MNVDLELLDLLKIHVKLDIKASITHPGVMPMIGYMGGLYGNNIFFPWMFVYRTEQFYHSCRMTDALIFFKIYQKSSKSPFLAISPI